MANTRNGNTWFVDTTGTLTTTGKNLTVTHIFYRSGASPSTCTIKDGSSDVKFVLSKANASEMEALDFSANPITFRTSINVSTLTNCTLTFVLQEG